MTNERIIQIDSVDAYNKLYGWETLHPLVTVVNHAEPMESLNHSRLRSTLVALLAKNYGLYALFLKQGDGCSIRYGREKYDYQEGTVVSFKPGQVVEVEWDESRPMPPSRGLLFHPDLLYGTQLARRINDYTFFDYDQREALHLSEREQRMVVELFDRIEEELQHPIDRHSQTLITDAIGLMLDYCMRYYDRQFITRHKVNSDIKATCAYLYRHWRHRPRRQPVAGASADVLRKVRPRRCAGADGAIELTQVGEAGTHTS